jgi:DNA-binding CsgD family transcriptional regulator
MSGALRSRGAPASGYCHDVSDALRARDLRTVLDVARTIGEADGLDTYREAVLEAAPRLVPGDVYGYNEVPPRRAEPLIMMWPAPPDDRPWREAVVRLAEEHPLVRHFVATGDPATHAISDLVSRRAFEESGFYRDVLSHVSGRDQLAVSIPGRDGLIIGLAVNRDRRGFSKREHSMYDTLRPFLLQGYRDAAMREHARAVIAALGAVSAAIDQPVVLVGARCHVEHMTPGAAELLGDSAPVTGARLGEPLGSWLREQRGRAVPASLRAGGWSARLVRGAAPGVDAIVLSPAAGALTAAALRAAGLTPRESEVIELVAAGLTNAAAGARLGIAEGTVAKHLQHVNEKLGVASRTAAVARLRELVTGTA